VKLGDYEQECGLKPAPLNQSELERRNEQLGAHFVDEPASSNL
jgi:hypothetical protein